MCRMRIRRGGSGAGHNGVLSSISSLGTDDFVRFRVGIGKPARKGSSAGRHYVLGRFTKAEAERLPLVITGVAGALRAGPRGRRRARDGSVQPRRARSVARSCHEHLWEADGRGRADGWTRWVARGKSGARGGRLPRSGLADRRRGAGACMTAQAPNVLVLVPGARAVRGRASPLAGRASGDPRLRGGRRVVPRPAACFRRSGQQAARGAGRARASGQASRQWSFRHVAPDDPTDHLARRPCRQDAHAGAGEGSGPGHRGQPPGRAGLLARGAGRGPRSVLAARRHPRRLSGGCRRAGPSRMVGRRDRDPAPVRSRKPAVRDGDYQASPSGPGASCCSARIGVPRPSQRLRESVALDSLRGMSAPSGRTSWSGSKQASAFPGVEFYAAYLDPSLPSLLDHLPADTVVVDFEPDRQRADARSLIDGDGDAGGGGGRGGRAAPRIHAADGRADRLDDFGGRPSA